ncbi:hypothetical protein NGR_b01460 (plasmid) [Sinorhizobium fredii NGR234]|uniref:Uncharacterized protein n=1 Tax=Sinorhizobium fredii (strain NBRC 101917 / NGR234) TaxID=394 RepID=C3KN39_SINFN|nr:hypothetical protein NGR_b01460 [Sinorhizobium fredii NGR234]
MTHGFRSRHGKVLKGASADEGGFVNCVFRSVRTCRSRITKMTGRVQCSTGSPSGLLKVERYENTVEIPCPTDVAAAIDESAGEFDQA